MTISVFFLGGSRRALCAVPLLLCLALPAFLGGCAGLAASDPYSKAFTAAEINANPAILDSVIVKGSNLSGLRLTDRTVTNATFYNTTSTGAVLRNVIFDNCRFINARFDQALLENVTFKGGIATCAEDVYNVEGCTRFTDSRFINLVLDGTYLENLQLQGNGGMVTIRNVHQATATHPIVTGADMRLVLENSVFRHMTIAELTGKSSLKAHNCTFMYAYFGNSTFANVDFYRNVTYGGPAYGDTKPASRRAPRR